MRERREHQFQPADPDNPYSGTCVKCGAISVLHRTRKPRIRVPRIQKEHAFIDNGKGSCQRCNLTDSCHRGPRKTKRKTDSERVTFIGIDGEGQGREKHRYVLLAASTEDGNRSWIAEPANGVELSTVECLDLILSLPARHVKIFSYSFNYDITKMLKDLDNQTLYAFFRPELKHRQGKWGPRPVKWGKYKLNLQGTKFTVSDGKTRRVIWDLFKFFQAKFVSALEDWKVGNPELWKRMSHMKDKRADFDKESPEAVKAYCLEECRCIAELARRLLEAADSAGLKMKTYYGAGSLGAAMLVSMGIKERLSPTPEAMQKAVAQAFFGGRFENSVIGAIREPLENLDISSAYPYQLTFLPCLQHGSWEYTTRRKDIEKAEAQQGALIHYSLGFNSTIETWGPFPFRTSDGTISFPIESGGGWVWLDEYLEAEKIFPHVEFRGAWVYYNNCACQPFKRIPEFYNLRQKIGKEGKGIVIKTGINSCYGKLAQSVGNAMFQSWIWAGMITSGCRAQILQVLALHKDWRNLLMIATDGIYTREHIITPPPLNTKTASEGKPLGGWERKAVPKGVFVARPGIYFPLDPTVEEIKQVRARGVGRSVVLESHKLILDTWEKEGVNGIARVANVTRFCGGKTSISINNKADRFKRANGRNGKPAYGQWVTRPVELSFEPKPKRERVRDDGLTLELRRFPRSLESVPYYRATAKESPEALELKRAAQEAIEQPDADLTDYEGEDGK